MKYLYSKSTDNILNYLTLKIKDEDIIKTYQYNSAVMYAKAQPLLAVLMIISLFAHSINYFILKDGFLFSVVVNIMQLGALVLWKILHKYSLLNSTKVNLYFLLVHCIMTTLLFWDMLGALNVTDKGYFQNNLLYNFMIATLVQINNLQWTFLLLVIFMVSTISQTLAEC